MTKHKLMYRPGLSAIAAFAAFGTTPLMAQAADPLSPSVESAPVVTSTPVVATPDPVAVPTVDPLAASTTAMPVVKAKPSVAKGTRTAARAVTRTTTARTAMPVRPPMQVAPASAAPAVAPSAPVAAASPPIADPLPLPTQAPVATAPTLATVNNSLLPADALPIGAAGLGALAIAGAALAMRRRKRRLAEDEFVTAYDEPAFAAEAPVAPVNAEPVPVVTETPVMAWGTAAAVAPATVAGSTDGDGEVPEGVDPTSHVAAAYRGPSAENPSLTLKTRLKRGAFFDQRERQAAAGEAAPLDLTAGLPDAVIDEMPDTPTETAPTVSPPLSTGGSYSLRPAPEHA